jgi:hypothetical protein
MWKRGREGRIIFCAKPGIISMAVVVDRKHDRVNIILVEGGGAVEVWKV